MVHCVTLDVSHKILNFLFGKSDNSPALNKIEQNIYILKENQLMQQNQIKEHYKLFNLTRVETA